MTPRFGSRAFARRYLASCWGRLIGVSMIARALAVGASAPLVAGGTWLLLASAGAEILADQDLALLAADPIAWVAGVVIGGGLGGVAALEQACLMTMVLGASRGVRIGVVPALRFTLARAWPVLRLATRVVVRCAQVSAPFVVAAALVYRFTLTEFDINFYLEQRPPAFWAAVGAALALGSALAVLLVRVLVRAAFAVPILLFEDRTPVAALEASAVLASGAWRSVLARAGAWFVASACVSAAGAVAVGIAGHLLVPAGSASVVRLMASLGAALAAFGVLQVALSALQAAALAATAVSLYEDHAAPADPTPRLAALASAGQGPLTLRAIGAWAAAAFAAGLVAGAWLVVDLEVAERTVVTAHRGASAVAPENTLAAVRQALDDGADWVEIDVQRTADDAVVVIHDVDLKRVAGVALRVPDSTLAALREHDIGSWFDARFADERVPTLEQVLDLCRGRAGVNIELKYYGPDPRLAERVVEIVEARGMAGEIVTMSLDAAAVAQVQALRPGWTVGLLSAVVVGDLTRAPADFLAVNASLATREFVRRAHARGKTVQAWTVNDALGMTLLASRGVDALITDEPALARAVLAERSAMRPAGRLLVNVALLMGIDPLAAMAQ